jgi:hypothetical protein
MTMCKLKTYTTIYVQCGSRFVGDNVQAFSARQAQEILNNTGRKHMKVAKMTFTHQQVRQFFVTNK